jgi:hypothetical protein
MAMATLSVPSLSARAARLRVFGVRLIDGNHEDRHDVEGMRSTRPAVRSLDHAEHRRHERGAARMSFAGLLAIALVVGSCGVPAAAPPEPRCEIAPAPVIIRFMPNWEKNLILLTRLGRATPTESSAR